MFARHLCLSRALRFAATLAFLLGLSAPAFAQDMVRGGAALQSQDDSTTPQARRVNRPLMLVGATLFVGSYAPSLAFATLGDWDADNALAVPVAGPWMALANPENKPLSKALLVNSGVMQGVGLVSMAASLLIPSYAPTTTLRFGQSEIHVAPAQLAVGSYGIGALGTF